MRVGVDTGGTFTDLVAADGSISKVPSTPDDPAMGIATAIGDRAVDVLAHGTTVATNALLERRGARVALVTNEGFADLIEIGRQDRPSLYDPAARRPEPLVDREHRLEVGGRLDAEGVEIDPLGPVPSVPGGVEAVAVCLLHSDRNPAHEQKVGDDLRSRGIDVTCSHEVSPQHREYERLSTTVANAYLRPVCGKYLERLEELAPSVLVLTSAGGLEPVGDGAVSPVRLLLSGPAGGVLAAAAASDAAGFPDCVTFDMGGTSTDVCLVLEGRPAPAGDRLVARLPIRVPSLDVHTIGAGGGSLAFIDPGGALAVGPRSAGAVPGPACYGRGGTQVTVTDADLVAGRIPERSGFPGLGTLDIDAAKAAVAHLGVDAEDVLAVVDAAMTQAVRRVSVERGVDPAGLALVAFGGAGPLHACAIADALGMAAVVVPPRAGVLSAAGILAAPEQVDLVRSGADAEGLAGDAAASLPGAVVETAVDCRYEGQSWELTVPSRDDFPAEHERRNGYRREGVPVEVVATRVTARRPSSMSLADLPPVNRSGQVTGPMAIAEEDCTIWVADGWIATVDEGGAWILQRSPS